MAAATDSSVAIFTWLLIRVHLIKPKAAVNYSGVFLFTRDEKSLRNKSTLYRVYQKSESLLMTPRAWTADLVTWLVTGLIWYKVFQVLLRRG